MIQITINNFEKYQPRKELKSLSWFRVDTGIFDGQTYFILKNDGIILFLFLLSLAAKDNKATFKTSIEFISEKLKMKNADILRVLNILEQNQLVHKSDQICADSCLTVHNNTLQTEQNNIDQNSNDESLNIDSVYEIYPRKIGKTKGVQKLRNQLKNENDLDLFRTAVLNYKKFIEKNKTESKFIKHFSTFVGEWRDWIDSSIANEPAKKKFENERVGEKFINPVEEFFNGLGNENDDN